ncbi:sarcoplasmic calcium-binding protein-like [Ruditapes philippinarum]|uniref:sarcoplasmic calcium-binding protein-like n=1 Tax=Ruditapes philippinarum TaxID=129788 RepID=UPI00295BC70B|nr:sarcoplasmic calcium-binding protein-like [Ruditapes philippinarum]
MQNILYCTIYVILVLSFNDEVASMPGNKTTKANNFLISKWKIWFSWFDHDKDCKVNAADLETARNRFANLHHLTSKRRKVAVDTYTKWWGEYLMWGQSEITEAEFVEYQRKAYESDKEMFVKRMWENEELVCNLMDIDGDGMITEKEHIVMFESAEHNDENVDRRWFNDLNPVNRKISVKTMVEIFLRFLTCDDSFKPDLIVELYQTDTL